MSQKAKSVDNETRIFRTFMVSIGLTLALSLSLIFLGISIRTRSLISDEILTSARLLLKDIMVVRSWNAGYGGVYVEKTAGSPSNPYLVSPDITSTDGKVYTKKTPEIMTREISEYFGRGDEFSFHITSLKLMDPNNAPDDFETRALRNFDQGAMEASEIVKLEGLDHFRYMAPLFVEEGCLACHAQQGYKVGDVRGGISVMLDITDVEAELQQNTIYIVVLGVLTIVLLSALIWYFTGTLMRKISDVRQDLKHQAVTDGLTGIFNRRHLMVRLDEEFSRARRQSRVLGLILFDIDHFKMINDEFGHLKGDDVLKEITKRVSRTIRSYDVFGRYGGEEFLVVMPDTDMDTLKATAERIRAVVADNPIVGARITISLGLATMVAGDSSIDSILKRTDEALYMAKNAGRNQACLT